MPAKPLARRHVAVVLAIMSVSLAPSAWLAWRNRDMPHFGSWHDDTLYVSAARSLAQGHGYLIESLPDRPYQTKYPPLYPLLLSVLWRINPVFPDNLQLAVLLAWLMMPPLVFITWLVTGSWLPALALALSPAVCLLATCAMSDILFTVLALAALLLAQEAERRRYPAAYVAAAAVLASAAYLTRTAGIALLISVPLVFLWRRRYRDAVLFASVMLPTAACWTIWMQMHMSAATDVVSLYYTSYIAWQKINIGLDNIGSVVWRNLNAFILGIGDLLIYYNSESMLGRVAANVLTALAVLGLWRSARRTGLTHFHAFVAAYVAMALIWHFPPIDRISLPVAPILFGGLFSEFAMLAGLVRANIRDAKQRTAAYVVGGAMLVLLCAGLRHNAETFIHGLPEYFEDFRHARNAKVQAYSWIARNTNASQSFFADDDVLLFLYTGRTATRLQVPTRFIYGADHGAVLALFSSFRRFVQDKQLDYVVLANTDIGRDVPMPIRAAAVKLITNSFPLLYRSDSVAIYRVP